ncbi:methyltransferase, FkbM family [Methylobacterium sp. 190mf]|uniref:FkbM family methyltransferase n=1 Tax=Methylobacterium sp. 190mf TaxID=1761798 RepID=UPI00089F0834|nr:FkbM family methyltransferase [Methylobacterium sp. 190mf]SEG71189.1 methyltransferase, FkbM family [Methylobacterium sp. 190mf]
MMDKILKFKTLCGLVGLACAVNIMIRRIIGIKNPIKIKIRGMVLNLRPIDSDLFVLMQIFSAKEYELKGPALQKINALYNNILKRGGVPLIVDAGANVGYSSIYFSEIYPDAHILAIEPDEASFQMLSGNCASLDKVTAVNAALWKDDRGVNLGNTTRPAWARTVSGEGTTTSITLEQALSKNVNTAPFILKLDVEGAERVIIEAARNIVQMFPVVMVEPHDFLTPGSGCLSPLYSAISGMEYDTYVNGENIIFCSSQIFKS